MTKNAPLAPITDWFGDGAPPRRIARNASRYASPDARSAGGSLKGLPNGRRDQILSCRTTLPARSCTVTDSFVLDSCAADQSAGRIAAVRAVSLLKYGCI